MARGSLSLSVSPEGKSSRLTTLAFSSLADTAAPSTSQKLRTIKCFRSNSYIWNMSREEVKTAINELLENTSEQVLQEVLAYLKSLEGKSEQSVSLSHNLRTILTEDKELLE